MYKVITISIDPEPGINITYIKYQAIMLAEKNDCVVQFTFNDTNLEVDKFSSAQKIYDGYNKLRE